MNWNLLQIILILWLAERMTIERSRYKIGIEGQNKKGSWAVWIYHKEINGLKYLRSGGRMLIRFENYIIPKRAYK